MWTGRIWCVRGSMGSMEQGTGVDTKRDRRRRGPPHTTPSALPCLVQNPEEFRNSKLKPGHLCWRHKCQDKKKGRIPFKAYKSSCQTAKYSRQLADLHSVFVPHKCEEQAFLHKSLKLRLRRPYPESSWPSWSYVPVPCQPAWSGTSSWRPRWRARWGGSRARGAARPPGAWAPAALGSGYSAAAPSLGSWVHHSSWFCSGSAAAHQNFSAFALCGTHTFLSESLRESR